MARYRVGCYGEWYYVADVVADSVAEAQEKLADRVRDGELKPIHGPGITFGAHRVIEEPEPR